VNQAATITTVSSSANPSTSAQSVTFTATVVARAPAVGTPMGTVTFRDGGTALATATLNASAVAVFQTATLTVGPHTITAVYGGDTNFTSSPSSALTQTVNQAALSGTPNQKYVTQLFRDILGREPDPSGLMHFAGQLDMNQASRAQVALIIETTLEARTKQVQDLYMQFLGRQADPIGLDLSTRFLGTGGSTVKLRSTIIGSPEYFQSRAGGTNDGFLSAVYRDVLKRAADSVGQSLGGQALASGIDHIKFAEVVFDSPEGQQDLVQNLYEQFLHRPADGIGMSNSTAALQHGIHEEQISMVIFGSDEYFGRL
jgi:hypothetical protein